MKMDLEKEFRDVVVILQQIETDIRVKKKPHLLNRLNDSSCNREDATPTESHECSTKVANIVFNHDSTDVAVQSEENLRQFSTDMISSAPRFRSFGTITCLVLKNNELMDIPGLSCLVNLRSLNLERNWFNTLPLEIGKLTKLETLIASRNFLRPNASSLLFDDLKMLPNLHHLDVRYNQKLGCIRHRDLIQTELSQLKVLKLTLWEEVGSIPGNYVGASAAERNEHLLRSQLEPWGTVTLRRRLVEDFGQKPTDPEVIDRAGVMERLLKCYEEEGLTDKYGNARRKRVYVDGIPISNKSVDDLLLLLRAWTDQTGKVAKNRERPSIRASNYMILRSEKLDMKSDEGHPLTTRASRRANRKVKKLLAYKELWDLALNTLKEVDTAFAERCTEIAVTYGFQGSPHIDKQNCGPFYGLALGDFPDGQGGICVESSARVIAVVNTKNRLGRVDGRFPHFVDDYDEKSERYSLIFYETGNQFVKPGPAIFSIPKHHHECENPSICE
jgi:hypothetical protein